MNITIARCIGRLTAVCITCASLGLVQAQPRDQRDHRGPPGDRGAWGQRGEARHPPPSRAHPPSPPQRPHWAPPHDRPMNGPGWRGAGPEHNWYRGGRLPPAYHSYHYVVDDWRLHRLPPPPRGYHWVQYGGDYLLVAITTGVILQIILSN